MSNKHTGDSSNTSGSSPKKTNWTREIISWVVLLAIAYLLAYSITHFVIIKTEIISGSMISTLNIGDRVVGNRLAYLFSDPDRGDVIFFAFPDDETKTYVKRIIGLPGEKVEIIDGLVYINDSSTPLKETYLNEEMEGSFGPYQVPEGHYFVLGDNRNISIDARYWDNTYVSDDQIFGKAWLRYKPTLNFIEDYDYE